MKIEVKIKTEIDGKMVTLIRKDIDEIENCKEGKILMLPYGADRIYTGIFGGLMEDEIYLKSEKTMFGINVPIYGLDYYFESVKIEK